MNSLLKSLCLLMALIVFAAAQPVRADDSDNEQLVRGNDPVVIELFSSQGCSYCPQADDFLSKLVKFDNIIALSCHVDYFDTPYWGDPMALPFCGARQQAYVSKFQKGPVYTPEMVINGDLEAVGYHFDEVLQTIRFADSRRMAKPVLSWADDKLRIELPESNLAADDTVVWVAQLREPRYLTVKGGANRGQRIFYTNIIARMGEIGSWHGQKKIVTVDTPPGERPYAYAVLLQNDDGLGRIVGAAILELPQDSEDDEGPDDGKNG